MVNQLRERRQRVGLTQQALGDLAGASRSMVRLLEQGYEPRRGSAVRERLEQVLDELEANRLLNAARVVAQLPNGSSPPATEAVARELAPLLDELEARTGQPSGQHNGHTDRGAVNRPAAAARDSTQHGKPLAGGGIA